MIGDDSTVAIREVRPMPIAAVRRQVTAATLGDEIVRSPVWSLTGKRGIRDLNQMVIVYHDRSDQGLLNQPGGVAVDLGVLVESPFESDRTLRCVVTPTGRAAHIRYHGPYEMLRVIHSDIRAWCADSGHTPAGINWEHYTHWHEEPERCVTDIYYLLR
jgi:effector-binding domain-containing protein